MYITTVREMPCEERPREKALQQGIEHCSNKEILALILRSGVPEASSLMIADQLLQRSQGVSGLSRLTLKELTQIKGISQVRGLEILACFELARRISEEQTRDIDVVSNPEALMAWLGREIGGKQQEHFLAIYLDAKNHILEHRLLFKGTLDASIVHPREVFKEALLASACRVLVVHNHPSQDLTPSMADRIITQRLKETGELIGIELLDHLIVGTTQYFSFRAHGLLD